MTRLAQLRKMSAGRIKVVPIAESFKRFGVLLADAGRYPRDHLDHTSGYAPGIIEGTVGDDIDVRGTASHMHDAASV